MEFIIVFTVQNNLEIIVPLPFPQIQIEKSKAGFLPFVNSWTRTCNGIVFSDLHPIRDLIDIPFFRKGGNNLMIDRLVHVFQSVAWKREYTTRIGRIT